METTYLTQERYDEIVQELKELKTKGRKGVAEHLKQAKELGDLSENADYLEARSEQSYLEQRISELEELVRRSAIIKKTASTATVRIASKVIVKKGSEMITYTITGSSESKPADGLISNESPIGRGLLGKKIGDITKIQTPKGEVEYEIVSIE